MLHNLIDDVLSWFNPLRRIDSLGYFIRQGFLFALMAALAAWNPLDPIGLIKYGLLAVSVIIAVQRLHDTGKGAWFVGFAFVPILQIVLVAFLFFMPSYHKKDFKNGYPILKATNRPFPQLMVQPLTTPALALWGIVAIVGWCAGGVAIAAYSLFFYMAPYTLASVVIAICAQAILTLCCMTKKGYYSTTSTISHS